MMLSLRLAISATVVPVIGLPTIGARLSLDARAKEAETDSPCMGDNVYPIVYFGERPSWSPDGHKIAFMSKSYGDGFELDLMTTRMRLLTGYQHAGYLRIQHLPHGDLFLIGPREFKDAATTGAEDREMWILKPGSLEPIALNHKIFEGVAISRSAERISWANTWEQYPDDFAEGESVIYVADIEYASGTPVLANKR